MGRVKQLMMEMEEHDYTGFSEVKNMYAPIILMTNT